MAGEIEALDYEAHRAYFREMLLSVHEVLRREYGLREIAIYPCSNGGSRLSIPARVEAVGADGREVKLFIKILGSSEMLTARAMQMFKNIFLKMFEKESLFDTSTSAETLAMHQYRLLKRIYDLGVPTARPLGCHAISQNKWLLTEEYLDAAVVGKVAVVTEKHLDTAFREIALMRHESVYHGDIKPENIIFADKVYILDVGNFLDSAPEEEMAAYDLASAIATCLEYAPPEDVLALALKHFSKREVRHAADYIELIQRRPDFNISDDAKGELVGLMRGGWKGRKARV
jgi:tRNA A-37 threonylcarbamoyl transferase component Bud32